MVATEEEGEKREGHRSPLPCTIVRHSYRLVPCLVKVMSVWHLSVVGVLRVALRGTCHSDGLRYGADGASGFPLHSLVAILCY